MVQHTMMAFDADLRALATSIVEMGTLTEKQLRDAVNALIDEDEELARAVIAADIKVDAIQQEIETKAIGTIACRQPFAVDLREIIGALRIANDLERIGDLAVNIAKRTEQMRNEKWAHDIGVQLKHMTHCVLNQLRRVIDSYQNKDLTEALEVWKADEEVDALHNSTFSQMLTHMMADPGNMSLGMHLVFCAKNIERIGDHTTNIAESIHYIVQGSEIPGERPKLNVTNFQSPLH